MSLTRMCHRSTEPCRHYGIFSITERVLLSIVMKIKAIAVCTLQKFRIAWIVLWMALCIYSTQSSSSPCNLMIKDVDEEFGFYQEGEFIIGGVFTIRAGTTNFKGAKSYMKDFFSVDDDFRALLNVLVFRFAIHKVNQNAEILPNITLGYHMTDSSLDAGLAVRNVLQILSGPQKTVPNYLCSGEGKLVGFIGDHYSVTTIPMAQILGLYGYTQISYGATDPSLTDRRLYPHVFRTVQNDHVHYLAVIELLKYFGWTWVGIFTTDDDAGDKEREILTKYMISHGICVEFTYKLGIETLTDDMSFKALEASAAVFKNSTSKVIVVCGSYVYINAVFSIFNSFVSDKTFIFPPIWVSRSSVHLLPIPAINGSLAVELYPLSLPDKEHFFDGIDKMNSTNNSPGSHYFLTIAKCLSANRGKSKIVCETTSGTGEKYPNMDGFVNQGVTPRIYYAVENLAKALHNMQLLRKGKSDNKRRHYYKHQVEVTSYLQFKKNILHNSNVQNVHLDSIFNKYTVFPVQN
ncbi:taste receptor type 1 member 3-like isoform X1 [Lithobates pipiens]